MTASEAAQDDPVAWPACMTCGTAWAHHRRLADVAAKGEPVPVMVWRWIWMRECGHRRAAWQLVDENGPIYPS